MENIKQILSKSIVRLLSPLVKLMLRYEVSHSEFCELAKRAYVNVAYRHYSIPGRKATYSRVSVLTGLSRKEVVRISELNDEAPLQTKGPLNRARRVIRGWIDDPDFLDDEGNPKELTLRDSPISFEELATRYSGDITARAILDELLRQGIVEKIDKKTVRLIHLGFIPQQDDGEKIQIIARHSKDLLETGIHNLTHQEADKHFQRQLIYHDLPEVIVQEFKQHSAERSMALLIELDKWLADKKQMTPKVTQEKTERIGLGIYYFQNNQNEDKS